MTFLRPIQSLNISIMINFRDIKLSILLIGTFLALLLAVACDSESLENVPGPIEPIVTPTPPANVDTRHFNLGFTPWPYDATQEAVDWVYEKTAENSDIVSHHLEEGVPWPEMYANQPLSGYMLQTLQDRKDRVKPWQKVLLSINPLNMMRDGMAPWYQGMNTMLQPLPAPWNGYALNSPQVKTAYLNYAIKMKEFFNPDYMVIGIEVNLLIRNDPTQVLWNQYLELNNYVSGALKLLYPTLPISASVVSTDFFPESSGYDDYDEQLAGLAALSASLDIVSFSVHPFMSGLFAESFPDDYFSRLFALTNKPIAITESSYPAQVWSIPSQPTWPPFNGSESKQDNFLNKMFDAAEQRQAAFVIWFCIRDYDDLWANLLGSSEDSLPWRDTGLYGEDGDERQALTRWRDWKAKPHHSITE